MRIDARPSQWAGVVLLVGWCAVLALFLPTLVASAEPETTVTVTPGARVSVGGVAIVPATGWTQSTLLPGTLIVKKDDAQLILSPPAATKDTLESVVEETKKDFGSDPSATYQVGEPTRFTTTSGLKGIKVVVLSPTDALVTYAFTDGTQLSKGQLSASDTSWKAVNVELDDMTKTVTFDPSTAAKTGGAS